MIHHHDSLNNSGMGYCVITGAEGKHKEPSLSETIDYGSVNAFEATIEPDIYTILVPYAKTKDQGGKISFLIYTKPEDKLDTKLLQPWQHSVSIQGEWKGGKAGGCQNERKTWHKNPFFSLIIPKKENVELAVVLSQKEMSSAVLTPYKVIAYEYYVGFYLYDADVSTKIGQVKKWKNSREVLQHFLLDGTKQRQYTIIPTTFDAGQETSFELMVYSDEKKVTIKEFEV